jgi:hypothetical protein
LYILAIGKIERIEKIRKIITLNIPTKNLAKNILVLEMG